MMVVAVFLLCCILVTLPLPNMAELDLDAVNCSTNFYTMEQSLLSSTDNRFNLALGYYPSRLAHPVIVKVDYTFKDLNVSQRWFWSESEFYFIQPLEVFQFSSLLFSNLVYRRSQLAIQLDTDCSTAPQEYFTLLTTRVSELIPEPLLQEEGLSCRTSRQQPSLRAGNWVLVKDWPFSEYKKGLHLVWLL